MSNLVKVVLFADARLLCCSTDILDLQVTIKRELGILLNFIIKLWFQAHMQATTKAQKTHSTALYSWAI